MALITQEVKLGGLGAGSSSLRSTRVRRSAQVEVRLEEPCSPYEAPQLSVSSTSLIQSHQQLHHDLSQVAVDQAVDLLQTQVRTRR